MSPSPSKTASISPDCQPIAAAVCGSITARRGRLARLRFKAGAGLTEHAHPQEEIVLVERGRLLFKLGESEYILGPGEFLLLPAGTAHEVRALGRRVAQAVVTQFGVGVLARRGKGVL